MVDMEMELRKRFVYRCIGLATRWGILKHPYGKRYVKCHYTITGKRRES